MSGKGPTRGAEVQTELLPRTAKEREAASAQVKAVIEEAARLASKAKGTQQGLEVQMALYQSVDTFISDSKMPGRSPTSSNVVKLKARLEGRIDAQAGRLLKLWDELEGVEEKAAKLASGMAEQVSKERT